MIHGTGKREHSRKEEDRRPVHALIRLLLRETACEDTEESADDGGGLHGNVDLLFEYHGDDNTNEDCRADDHLARILCLLLFLGKCLTVHKIARAELAADGQHIDHADDREWDADPCELEESERRETARTQRRTHEDVRRRTDHRNRTANVRRYGECHELRRDRQTRGSTDLDDDGHEAGNRRRV